MKLFAIRHAHAIDLSDDFIRPLSDEGHEQALALGAALKARGDFAPAEIWHSPLVRARETAELIAEALGENIPLVEVAGLAPEDDPQGVVERVREFNRDVAIVGHEPHLGILGGLLLYGDGGPAIVFKKASGYLFEPKPAPSQTWSAVAKLEARIQ